MWDHVFFFFFFFSSLVCMCLAAAGTRRAAHSLAPINTLIHLHPSGTLFSTLFVSLERCCLVEFSLFSSFSFHFDTTHALIACKAQRRKCQSSKALMYTMRNFRFDGLEEEEEEEKSQVLLYTTAAAGSLSLSQWM